MANIYVPNRSFYTVEDQLKDCLASFEYEVFKKIKRKDTIKKKCIYRNLFINNKQRRTYRWK